MNRLQIVNLVKEYLNRPNLSETSVESMISAVEGDLNRLLRDHPRNIRRTSYTQTGGDEILPLPTDIAILLTLRTGNTIWEQFWPDQLDLVEGRHYCFIARGDVLELFSAPDEDTLFKLDYVAFLKPLADDLDENWVSTYYPDLYLYGALKEAAVFLKDDARLQLWQGEFLKRVTEVDAQGWNQNIGVAPQMRPV